MNDASKPFAAVVIALALGACSVGNTERPQGEFRIQESYGSAFLVFDDAFSTTSPMSHVSLQLSGKGDPTLRDGKASLDGVPLAVAGLGGRGTVPTFRSESLPTPRPQSVLQVTDGHASMQMTVDNLLAPRSISLVDHPEGKLRAGETATLVWSPATDALLYAVVVFRPKGSKSADDSFQGIETRVSGDRITFRVPSGRTLSGVLAVTTAAELQVRSCVGVVGCNASTSNLTVAIPIEIAP